MKAIVIYYSLEGTTDYMAKHIAGKLYADVLKLEPEKKYPIGGSKYRKFISTTMQPKVLIREIL